MGPTKAIVKDQGLYDAVTGKFIKDGFASLGEIEEYVKHHYLALPVVDNAGKAWVLDEKPVYCFRIVGEWAYARTKSLSNPTASAASRANTSSMRDWK